MYLSFIPIDLSRYRSLIASRMEEAINGRVKMDGVSLKVLPWPLIRLRGVSISERGRTVIKSETASISISPLSFFRNEVLVHEIKLIHATIYAEREEDGLINLNRLIKSSVPPARGSINGGHIYFTDRYRNHGASYELSTVQASFKVKANEILYMFKGILLPKTAVTLSGSVIGLGNEPGIKGRVAINDIDVTAFKPYFKSITDGVELDAKTDLQADFIYKDKRILVSGSMAYNSLSLDIPSISRTAIHSKKGSTKFRIEKDSNTVKIEASDLTATMRGFDANSNIKMIFYSGGGFLSADITSSPIPISSIEYYTKILKLPPSISATAYGIKSNKGEVRINNLKLSGTLRELSMLDHYREAGALHMDISLNDLNLKYSGLLRTMKNISGEIKLDDGKLYLIGITGRYGKSIIKKLAGEIVDGDFDIGINSVVDSGEITEELNRAAWKKKISFLREIKVSGNMAIDVDIKGSLKKGTIEKCTGKAIIDNLVVIHKELPLPVNLISGEIKFDAARLGLNAVKGSIDNSPFSVDGTIYNYLAKRSRASIVFSGNMSSGTFKRVLRDHLPQGFSIEDNIKLSGKLERDEKKTRINSLIDATDARVGFKSYLKKERGLPLTAALRLSLKNSIIVMEKSQINLAGSSIQLSARFPRKIKRYALTLSGNRLNFASLVMVSPYLKERIMPRGSMDLMVRLSKQSEKALTAMYGKANIKNGALLLKTIPDGISDINADIQFNRNKARVKIKGIKVGKSSAYGWVNILDLANRKIRFNLSSNYLDLADLPLKNLEEEGIEKFNQHPITGRGQVAVKKGRAFGLRFSSLKTAISIDKKGIVIAPLTFIYADNGSVAGSMKYFRQNNPILFKSSLEFYNVDMKSFLRASGAKEAILSGRVEGTLKLSLKRWTVPFSRGINGSAKIYSRDGKMWRFIVMSKIFSIVNIISIDQLFEKGLPYRTLSGDLLIKNGKIISENLLLNSDSMRMSAVGDIDLAAKRVDANLGLHPFVTIDKFITKIPIAGWIIGGKEKSTISMYYEIKGPLANPDVRPVPVKSLGEKVFGIFKRVLEAPIKTVEPLIDNNE